MKMPSLLFIMLLTASYAPPASSTSSTRVHRNTNQLVLNYGPKGHPYDAHSSSVLPATRQLQADDGASSILIFDPSQRYPVKKPSASPTIAPSVAPSTVAPTFIAYDSSLYEPLRMWDEIDHFISSMTRIHFCCIRLFLMYIYFII